jgi:hypothetical protein
MTDLRTAAQQALEFVTSKQWGTTPYMDVRVYEDAARLRDALRAALAQPEQEPVAWRYRYSDGYWRFSNGSRVNGCDPVEAQPLYTHPAEPEPPPEPIHEDKIRAEFREMDRCCLPGEMTVEDWFEAGVRFAEKHHEIV